MKIPVYLRATNSTTRECVAISETCHLATHIEARLVQPRLGSPMDTTEGFSSRAAKIHALSDGNLYAEELVRPSEYQEALTFWRNVFTLNMRPSQPISSYCGWITPRN